MPSASSESSKVSQNSSLVYDPEPVTASGFTTTKPVREYNGGMRRKSATEHDDEIKLLVRNASGGATNVRKTLQQDHDDHLLLIARFNFKEFLLSMVYESTPPFVNCVIALLLEGPSRAYHLVNHRLFLPIDKSYQSSNPGVMVIFWIAIIPMLCLCHLSYILTFLYYDDVKNGVCVWELGMGLFSYLCRNAILSIKYAYYNDEELEGLRRPAPEWTDAHQNRKLIGAGWRYPLEHEDLVEDELEKAQSLCDVHLHATSFRVDDKSAKALRNYDTHKQYPADNGHSCQNSVSASFVLHQLLRTGFGDDCPVGIDGWICAICPLACALTPNITRMTKGQWGFGESHLEKTIHASMFIMRAMWMGQLFLFGYIAASDFQRRYMCMKLIGKMTVYPGVKLGDFVTKKDWKGVKKQGEIDKKEEKGRAKLEKERGGGKVYTTEDGEEAAPLSPRGSRNTADMYDDIEGRPLQGELSAEEKELRFYIDLRDPNNTFAWTLIRRTAKAFGSGYFGRVQAYVGVLFTWSVVAMVVLNGLFWAGARHFIGTPYYMIFTVFCITICVLKGISAAVALQGKVSEHRMILKNEIFSIDQTVADNFREEREVLGTPGKEKKPCARKMAGPPSYGTGPLSPFRKSTPKPVNFAESTEQKEGLLVVKSLLKTADDLIGYHEEMHNPVTVMGVSATGAVYNSTIGILITFAVLAVEGFSSGGLGYLPTGWSTYA